MKLDLSVLQYLTTDDFRVLTAIEMGMRNHEIVPVSLIQSIAKIKRGNTFKIIQTLLKHKLVEHSNTKYDGYSLNYLGYDFLALNVLIKRKILVGVGSKIGVGKESDVFLCYIDEENMELLINEEAEKNKQNYELDKKEEEKASNEKENGKTENIKDDTKLEEIKENNNVIIEEDINIGGKVNFIFDGQINNGKTPKLAVLKLARLGRTSFSAVRTKRDYLKNRTQYNWLYLSRLSAESEYKFLKGLYNYGFPVPRPYDHNRHAILMEFIPGYPLCNINEIGDKEKAFNELIGMILKLANCGLVHGDFNEFNILLTEQQKIYLIDFPQMISSSHPDAKVQFNRDIECIFNYFRKKFNISFDERPDFEKDVFRSSNMDIELKASGYNFEGKNIINAGKNNVDEGEEALPEDCDEESSEEDCDEDISEEEGEVNNKKKWEVKDNKKKKEKAIEEILDDLDIEDEICEETKEENKIDNVREFKQNIREDIQKIIKKHTKVNFKSNRFKNKKTAKTKNSMI